MHTIHAYPVDRQRMQNHAIKALSKFRHVDFQQLG